MTNTGDCKQTSLSQVSLKEKLLNLPSLYSRSIEYIEKNGSAEDFEECIFKITGAIVSVEHDIARRQLVASINPDTIEQLKSDEDIVNLSNLLTSNTSTDETISNISN